MYCTKCGNKLKDGNKFCGKCGQKISKNEEKFVFKNDKKEEIEVKEEVLIEPLVSNKWLSLSILLFLSFTIILIYIITLFFQNIRVF